MPTVVEEALEYASHGWHVLPGIPGEKRPYLKWAEASCDEVAVTKMFEMFERAEILVLCGPSKLAVLDLDGPWLDIPLLPYTWEAETPRGGRQYIFTDPDGIVPTTASKLHPKVDTRGVGGLFVAPSVNSPKRRWRTKTVSPAQWPEKEFPTLGLPRAMHERPHTDEIATWQPLVGERLPNEDCPGEYHLTTGRQPRLGVVRYPSGHIEARCWSGCDVDEINTLLVERGRYTREELGLEGKVTPVSERFITRDTLMSIEPPTWMIEPYLQEHALVMLAAKFNTGKTFVAVDWALRLSTQGRRVLYLALEGLTGLQSRVAAWEEYNGLLSGSILFNPRNYRLNLLSDRLVDSLVADIEAEGGFDLVVLDNLGEAVPGDENDSEVVGKAMDSLNRIRLSSGGAVLDVHNSGHGGSVRARGHSKMLDVHDTVIYLEAIEGSIHGLKVICGKERNAERFTTRRALLKPVANSLVAVQGGKAVAEADPIYNAIKLGHNTANKISDYLNMPYTTAKWNIARLLEMGDIQELPIQGKEKRFETLWDKEI